MQWITASMPVAAVSRGGRPRVRSGSQIAIVGHRQGNCLGQVHRRTAVERHDAVTAVLSVTGRRVGNRYLRRILVRTVIDRKRHVVGELSGEIPDHTQLHETLIGAEQWPPDPVHGQYLLELPAGAMVEDGVGQ